MMNQRQRFGLIGLMLAVAVSIAADGPPKNSERGKLHCNLTAEQKSFVLGAGSGGELELRNDSKEPITIKYVDDPTDYLTLDIWDSAGKLLPKGIPFYGGLYAKLRMKGEKKQVLTIKPGETYRQGLSLFAITDMEADPLAPGKYTIQAVYTWSNYETRSNKVTVEILKKENLHCGLLVKQHLHPIGEAFAGVLELRNDSKEPITIEYNDDPTEHLALDLQSFPGFKTLPKSRPFYGVSHAKPRPVGAKKKTLTIKPGERYHHDLSLFAQTDQRAYPIISGEYLIEAVYTWAGTESRSNTVILTVQMK